jgi:hypothetical protein
MQGSKQDILEATLHVCGEDLTGPECASLNIILGVRSYSGATGPYGYNVPG